MFSACNERRRTLDGADHQCVEIGHFCGSAAGSFVGGCVVHAHLLSARCHALAAGAKKEQEVPSSYG
jgi:hypothetical protein